MVKIEAFNNSILVGGQEFPKDTLTFKIVRKNGVDLVRIFKLNGTTLSLGQYFEYIDSLDAQYTSLSALIDDLRLMFEGGGGTSGGATEVTQLQNKTLLESIDSELSFKGKLLRWDDYSTSDIYLGYADSGSVDANPVWAVKKIEESTGIITWADGDKSFDNIWDDRLTLTYV